MNNQELCDKYNKLLDALKHVANWDAPGCKHGHTCGCEQIYAQRVLREMGVELNPRTELFDYDS